MKMLDLINEAETNKDKNKRHRMDLDDLEREIRKSQDGIDKDTQSHIDKKRKELAMNKAKMDENISSAMAAVVMPMGDNKMQKRNGTVKNALDMDTNIMGQKKKKRSKKKT